mgnify:CR=1 FL=1
MGDDNIVNGLAQLQLMAETTIGYYRKLLDGGIPEGIANRMAKDFHVMLIKAAEASFYKDKRL